MRRSGRLLLLLHGEFGFLHMQVPKLVGDEVEAAEGDLLARLHPFHSVVDVDDDSHLKHDINLNAKRPLPGAPTVGLFSSDNA